MSNTRIASAIASFQDLLVNISQSEPSLQQQINQELTQLVAFSNEEQACFYIGAVLCLIDRVCENENQFTEQVVDFMNGLSSSAADALVVGFLQTYSKLPPSAEPQPPRIVMTG